MSKGPDRVDLAEAREIMRATRFDAWAITGPGRGQRSRVECPTLARARELIKLGRHLVYAQGPGNFNVCVTARNLLAVDAIQQQQAH